MASRDFRPAKRNAPGRRAARDVMNRSPVCASPHTTLAECARLMREHGIGVLPVIDADRQVIGIVSERDLLRTAGGEPPVTRWTDFLAAPAASADVFARAAGRPASDVMTTRVICVRPEMPLAEIATILDEWKIERVPVIADGRIVGILGRSDLVRTMIDPRRARTRIAATDQSIRADVVSHLEQITWLSGGGGIEITVTDGTVILYGFASSAEEAVAIEYLAEGVPGVRAVESYLRVGQHSKYRN